jgi:hypothetical protein
MKPDQFDKRVKKADGGEPIVVLMRHAEGGERFLSLVDKGANGRTFTVTKAEGPIDGDVPAELTPKDGTSYQAPWSFFTRIFAPLLGLGAGTTAMKRVADQARKDAGPLTFEAALVPGEVYERMWDGYDALCMTIGNILREPTVTDKKTAVNAALESFAAYVGAAFEVLGVAGTVTKAEDLQAISQAANRAGFVTALIKLPAIIDRAREMAGTAGSDQAFKAGRVISAANAAKIRAAIDNLESVLETAGLIEPDEPETASKTEDETMKLEEIQRLAEGAATTAIKVAKAANPKITDADLVRIAGDAAQTVFKTAVGGPAQPGMPANALDQQIADSAAGFRPGADSLTLFQSKLNSLGDSIASIQQTVVKIDATVNGSPASADGKTPAEPGLVDVVRKQAEVITAVTSTVQKMSRTPARPNGSAVEEARQTTRKQAEPDAADDVFNGSPFDFGSTKPEEAAPAK